MSARHDGESSRRSPTTPENGGQDASNESDRPMKKARFSWQVKGKYHARRAGRGARSPGAGAAPDGEGAAGLAERAEHNLEILGNYLLKHDLGAPEGERDSPPSQVVRAARAAAVAAAEDRYLEAWQARQMAKGFVDNTINRVLDSWQAPRRPLAADLAFSDLPRGVAVVEDRGILAAISAHGLHRPAPEAETSTWQPGRRSSSVCDGDGRLCCHTRPAPRPARAASPPPASAASPPPARAASPPPARAASPLPARAASPPPAPPPPPPAPELDHFMDAAVEFAIQHTGLTSLGYHY